MEENQTNQNSNQQPLQSAQPEFHYQQQVQRWEPQPAGEPSVAMQIQELLVQQQQYQQQYNQLVDYVKKTPNLPIEQVNQIKQQLDQLNALFVQWKQKLQELWYTQVQVQKPTDVKKWAKNNFSFKKLAIWCGIVVVLILAWFFVTLSSLIKTPNALRWIWVDAATAKMLMMVFCGLIFWSIILLMLWVIISNIYKLITVQNQKKWKFVFWLLWWLIWAWAIWAVMWIIFGKIWNIVTDEVKVEYDIVQPYLVWRVEHIWNDEFLHPYDNKEISWIGTEYNLIAPAEMAFSLREEEFSKYLNENIPSESENFDITLSCGNNTDKALPLMKDEKWNYIKDWNWWFKFQWTCLYDSKWEYKYSVNVTYYNKITKERQSKAKDVKSLKFDSEISISKSSNGTLTKLKSSNWEFNLWKAPVKITIDSAQIFRDFWLWSYESEWDLDGDFITDRVNQVSFDYSYKIPKVYYITYKIPWLSDDTWYRFPVRVEQSDRPICGIDLTNFPWTTKYQISTNFVDASSAATISSYNYTIQNVATKKTLETLKNHTQEFNYTFPEEWSYVVVLEYVTVDGKQWQCESDTIKLKKETFRVQYSIQDLSTLDELCNSNGTAFDKCTQINISEMPKIYRLRLWEISPSSPTLKKYVSFNGTVLLNEDDTYTFSIPSEWSYNLAIVVSDEGKWIEETTFNIQIVAKKRDVVWNISVLTPDTREEISDWFEPLSVILDASKTEINIPWDEIVYFTWDFGDWEVKKNQQNWVISHTYNYNYTKENWSFQPKVTIETKQWHKEQIVWPRITVKKWLVAIDLYSLSHPSRQARVGEDVTFEADFDWFPEQMVRDFGDWSYPYRCEWRMCTEHHHSFQSPWLYSVKVSIEFEAGQQVEEMIDFKVY